MTAHLAAHLVVVEVDVALDLAHQRERDIDADQLMIVRVVDQDVQALPPCPASRAPGGVPSRTPAGVADVLDLHQAAALERRRQQYTRQACPAHVPLSPV